MDGWNIYKIQDIAYKMADAPFGSNLKTKDYTDTGIVVVQGKNLLGRICKWTDVRFVSKNKYDSIPRSHAKVGDLVFPKVGTIGKVGILTPYNSQHNFLLSTNTMKLEVNRDIANQYFVYYFFSSPKVRNHINQISSKSVQPVFNYTSLKNYKITLPPLSEQHRIAEILGALDDKIELNLAMNKTLEEMAMAIYKEWFVEFGPFQDGEFVDSELGKIPKGWEVVKLEDVCIRITDGSHRSPKSMNSGFPMASVKDMHDWGLNIDTCRKISKDEFDALVKNDCKVIKDDILIAKDGSYLKHVFVAKDTLDVVLLSSIAILRPNEKIIPHYLSSYLKLPQVAGRMKNIVSGAVIPRIILKDFRKFSILRPPEEIQKLWWNKINSNIECCYQNIQENRTLAKTRDALLPKLISGEIRVKTVEEKVEEALN